jgi:uncharacterized protein (TIGR02246 family)
MRTTLSLIGVTLLAGVALALAAAGTQATQAPAAPAQAAPAAPAQAAPAAVPANPEETAVRALHLAFVKAYNAEDVQTLSDLFTPDAAVIDSAGQATRGRAQVTAMYAASFQDVEGLKLESAADAVRFLTPDVAEVEGQFLLSGGGAGDARQNGTFAALVVRRDGRWRLAEIRDYPAPPEDITSYDHLKELEWMVGDWVDESGNAKVHSSIRWAVNESFLIRTYRAEVSGERAMDGTMFIGWDPQTGQIKSWVFDSEGGHGEGLWTRVAENRWVVKAHGVTRDGRPNSATQIHTVVSKDSVNTSSIDRIIGGEIAPDVTDVLMVRQPPAAEPVPAATPAQPSPPPGAPK